LNLFARAFGQSPTTEGDLILYTNSVNIVAKTNPDDVGDDLNHIINLLMAHFFSPSDTSERALFLYAKNRPISYGCYLGQYRAKYGRDLHTPKEVMIQRIQAGIASGWQPDCPRVLGALRWYFRYEEKGNPQLAELYAPIVERFLS
jgi:hypothetical protein